MIDAVDARYLAREGQRKAVAALQEWTTTNERRVNLAAKIRESPGNDEENREAYSTYMKICEIEMMQAGAAIFALTNCLQAFNQAYEETTGESLTRKA